MAKTTGIRAFRANRTRIVFLATLLFLLGVLTPLATAFNSPSASVHVLSGGYYTCDGVNHTAPVEIYIPPPPYRTVTERGTSFTNCVEVQISSCRYEAGLSIILMMASLSPSFEGGGRNHKAKVWIAIENSTLLSPTNGSVGAGAAPALLLTSSSRLPYQNSSVSNGPEEAPNKPSSFVLDFVMVNSLVKAHTTTSTSGSAYAVRFASISLVESSIDVVSCTIEASAYGTIVSASPRAYAWAYENINMSDSTIITTDCSITSSSYGGGSSKSYVWHYEKNNNILNSTLQTVGCNITSSSGSYSYVWYYGWNNNILNSTLQTVGCNITSNSSSSSYVWYYESNNNILNSTLQTVGCNIASSGGSNSYVWYYSSTNNILNSTLQTVGCNIASSGSSYSYVWYYNWGNNILQSTLQTVGCNITSNSGSYSYVWYYSSTNNILNSTLQTVGCNITSSGGSSSSSYVWYYDSNNNMANSTLQTVGCNIASSGSSNSYVWYYSSTNNILHSTLRTVGCNITSSGSSYSYVWYYNNNNMANSTLQTVGCNITSNSGSYSYVWYYSWKNNIANSTLQTMGCNITSSGGGSRRSSYVWYYERNNNILNSTLQTVGCNITSSSSSSSYIWYYESNNNIANSTVQTMGCNITSSSGSSNSYVWYYSSTNTILNSTLQTVGCNITSSGIKNAYVFFMNFHLDNTSFTFVNSSARMVSSMPSVNDLVYFNPSSASTAAFSSSTFYWSNSRYILGNSGTPLNLPASYQCGGVANCSGLTIRVDSPSLPLSFGAFGPLFYGLPLYTSTVSNASCPYDDYYYYGAYYSHNDASLDDGITSSLSLCIEEAPVTRTNSSWSPRNRSRTAGGRCDVYTSTATLAASDVTLKRSNSISVSSSVTHLSSLLSPSWSSLLFLSPTASLGISKSAKVSVSPTRTIATRTGTQLLLLPSRSTSIPTTKEPTGNDTDAPTTNRSTLAPIPPPPARPSLSEATGGEAAGQSVSLLTAVSAVMANPVTMLQLDAVSSVMGMAACTDGSLIPPLSAADDNDKHDDTTLPQGLSSSHGASLSTTTTTAASAQQPPNRSSEEACRPYDFSNNPLHLFIGPEGGAAERGSLLTCLLIMVAGTGAVAVYSIWSATCRKDDNNNNNINRLGVTAHPRIPFTSIPLLLSFPSVLLTPAAFTIRLTVRSAVRLALFSTDDGGRALAAVAFCIVTAYIAHVFSCLLLSPVASPTIHRDDDAAPYFRPAGLVCYAAAVPATGVDGAVLPRWHQWLEGFVGPSCIWMERPGEGKVTGAKERTERTRTNRLRSGVRDDEEESIGPVRGDRAQLEEMLLAGEVSTPDPPEDDELVSSTPSLVVNAWLSRYEKYITKSRGVAWFGAFQLLTTAVLKALSSAETRASCLHRNIASFLVVLITLLFVVGMRPRPVPSDAGWNLAVLSNALLLVCCAVNTANAVHELQVFTNIVVWLTYVILAVSGIGTVLAVARLVVNTFPMRVFGTSAPPPPAPLRLDNGTHSGQTRGAISGTSAADQHLRRGFGGGGDALFTIFFFGFEIGIGAGSSAAVGRTHGERYKCKNERAGTQTASPPRQDLFPILIVRDPWNNADDENNTANDDIELDLLALSPGDVNGDTEEKETAEEMLPDTAVSYDGNNSNSNSNDGALSSSEKRAVSALVEELALYEARLCAGLEK